MSVRVQEAPRAPGVRRLAVKDADYPRSLSAVPPLEQVAAIGNLALLERPALGLFCSIRCTGDAILRTYDAVRGLRDAGIALIGGFHSPMEKECLTLLLRGRQPLIVCPARGLDGMRLPAAYSTPLARERLLVLSPFGPKQRRVTAETSRRRNELVAALAAQILIAHAAPGGKIEQFVTGLLKSGKAVWTLATPDNDHLIAQGARPFPTDLEALKSLSG